jgi:8-oxo-dGTP pyrophosphatase MutT (NUDIX family)
MKKLWNWLGNLLFWLLWPALWIHLRYGGVRSRILVVCDGEALFLRGWLSIEKFGLPGGGSKKGESIEAGAVRELEEETGIVVAESSLVKLGTRMHKEKGLHYQARFFTVTLDAKPELKLPWYEIVEARWVNLADTQSLLLNAETLYALKRYQPPEQASLL